MAQYFPRVWCKIEPPERTQKLCMLPPTTALTEESLQNLESHNQELAQSALRRAYYQALTSDGAVLEARNGQLVEVSAEGHVRIVRSIATPLTVPLGTKRIRSRSA